MDGVLLVVNDEWPVSCPGATSRGTLVGCYHMGERVITVTAGWLEDKFVSSDQPCVENLAVPHEVLHAYIGDPQHSDPRWAKLTDIWYEYVLQEHPECYAFMAWRWW